MYEPDDRAHVSPTTAGGVLSIVGGLALLMSWVVPSAEVLGLVGATTLTLLAVSFRYARRNLRELQLALPVPVTAFASERFELVVQVATTGRVPARGLELFPVLRVRGVTHLPELPAYSRATLRVPHRIGRRGTHASQALVTTSRFPWGLFEARRQFSLAARLCILPRPGLLSGLVDPPVRLRRRERELAPERARRDGDEDFFGMREWRAGETLRRIHWPLSLRRDRRLIREVRSEARAPRRVVLVTVLAGRLTATRRNSFETAVALCATLVERGLREGRAVRVDLWGGTLVPGVLRSGRRALRDALVALADVSASALVEGVPEVDVPLTADGHEVFVVAGCGMGELARELAPSGARVLDVDAREMRHVFRRAAHTVRPELLTRASPGGEGPA